MFRLLVNIGGVFDVYVSGRASEALRTAILPTLATTGRVGGLFVERLRFGERVDYGRNRYLLLLTTDAMAEVEKRRLVGSLEQAVGAHFDRLMEAVNRDEVSEDLQRIYAACARLDAQEDAAGDHSKSRQVGEASRTAGRSQSAVEAEMHQAEEPGTVRAQANSKNGQRPDDTTVNAGSRDGGGSFPHRPVSLGTVVAINLVLSGLFFGSMAWYLKQSIERITPAGGVAKLLENVDALSTRVGKVERSVSHVDKTVEDLSKSSGQNWRDIRKRLQTIDGTVGGQTGTKGLLGKVDALSAKVGTVEDSLNRVDKTVKDLSKSSGQNWRDIRKRLQTIDGTVGGQTGTKGLRGKVDALSAKVGTVEDSLNRVDKTVKDLSKSSGQNWTEIRNRLKTIENTVGSRTETKRPLEDLPKEASEWVPTVNEVKKVQTRLKTMGFYNDEVDGKIGPATKRGIGEWQEKNQISKTETLDQRTFEAIVDWKPSAASDVENDEGEAEP